MHIDPRTMARAQLAVRDAVGRYLFDRERKINVIDAGFLEEEGKKVPEVAIRFHVDELLSGPQLEAVGKEELPRELYGFPREVIKGRYRTQQGRRWGGWWRTPVSDSRTRNDPLVGGISISSVRHYGAGTLGGLVVDRTTGDPMVASCFHVLARDWTARPGQHIYQPGRLDGGQRGDTIASLTRHAMSSNLDAAVASLTGSRDLINKQLAIGPVRGVGRATLGMEVVKSGRTTGRTSGVVTGIEGTARLSYSGIERIIRNVITVEPDRPFGEVSRGGDSGAWYLDRETQTVIGLHFAGSDSPERGLGMDMRAVLDALNIDVVTDIPRL